MHRLIILVASLLSSAVDSAIAVSVADSYNGADGSTRPGTSSSCNGPSDLRLDIGCVRGRNVGGVDKWLGIPFATPPTGELRFKAPTRLSPIPGIINATQPGNCCWGAVSTQLGLLSLLLMILDRFHQYF
jgi:hypothetical protein